MVLVRALLLYLTVVMVLSDALLCQLTQYLQVLGPSNSLHF